jgi:hypothetical protein
MSTCLSVSRPHAGGRVLLVDKDFIWFGASNQGRLFVATHNDVRANPGFAAHLASLIR